MVDDHLLDALVIFIICTIILPLFSDFIGRLLTEDLIVPWVILANGGAVVINDEVLILSLPGCHLEHIVCLKWRRCFFTFW